MHKKIIIFLFLIVSIFNSYSDAREKDDNETVLLVSLIGREYEHLRLVIMMETPEVKRIDGKKIDKYNWQFTIPDSIYDNAFTMKILEYAPDTVRHSIVFRVFDNMMDTWATPDFIPDKRYCKLEVEFIESKTDIGPGNISVIFDFFLYKEINKNKRFISSINQLKQKTSIYPLPYNERIEKSLELYKKNKDSRMYISLLANELNNYKSRNDIQLLFDCFSDSIKQTTFGTKIKEYLLFEKFPNEKFSVSNISKEEYILSDPSKHNLVLFSASWCAPCHKLIPELKKIYEDLKNNIVFTYVSIDDQSTIGQWEKLLITYEIPWRSLTIENDKDLSQLRDIYFVQSIPLSYFVYPDGSFEKLDINEKEDIEKLYRLAKNK